MEKSVSFVLRRILLSSYKKLYYPSLRFNQTFTWICFGKARQYVNSYILAKCFISVEAIVSTHLHDKNAHSHTWMIYCFPWTSHAYAWNGIKTGTLCFCLRNLRWYFPRFCWLLAITLQPSSSRAKDAKRNVFNCPYADTCIFERATHGRTYYFFLSWWKLSFSLLMQKIISFTRFLPKSCHILPLSQHSWE